MPATPRSRGSRRWLRPTASGLIAVLGVWLSGASPAAAEAAVTVDTGQLRGSESAAVQSFKGIPYAAAPTGALRWRAPQPAPAWTGVRDATEFRNDCMQVPFPSDAAPLGVGVSEDCLYLNVWRPTGTRQGPLPVVVWIHGGGFLNGGSSPATHSGADLARHGVVFVSINYRLGRLGTFAHPALTRENAGLAAERGMLANYGTMDQIAALQWVQRNIGAFGGNAENVTVIGESAGGMSIHHLLTSPRARGLVDRAVIMSGGDAGSLAPMTLPYAEQVGLTFARKRGVAAEDAHALADLRALPAEQIGDLSMTDLFGSEPRDFVSPFADGTTVVDAAAAYRSGDFDRVPVMVGATSADLGGRDGMMIAGARDVAGLLADQGITTYAYRFSYVAGAGDAAAGAQHASDVPFFLGTEAIKYGPQTTATDIAVGDTITAYLARFALTGDPNGAGLPYWPRYSRAGDELVDFATYGRAIPQKDPWG